MAPNAAEESEKHEEEVGGHHVEEDEIDGGRGDYGRRVDFDDRLDSVFTNDFVKRDDYGMRREDRVKRSDSGQRGDYGLRRESRHNEDYVKRGDYGMRDNSRRTAYVTNKNKFLEPVCDTFPPRETSLDPQDWEDQEFPYGRLRGNYRQIRSDERDAYGGRDGRGYYGSDFDRYRYERGSRYYDTDRRFGRSPFPINMQRYRQDEPYSFDGTAGRERNPFSYERNYDRMNFGRYGNGMKVAPPYGYRFIDSYRPDNNGWRDYGWNNKYALEPTRLRDRERYGHNPDYFSFGNERDLSQRKEVEYRNTNVYNPYHYYYDNDLFEEGPYGRNYGVQDRYFSFDQNVMDPFENNYANTRPWKSPFYGSYGRYGVAPSKEMQYFKNQDGIPRFARYSSRSRNGDRGVQEDHYSRFKRVGRYGRRPFGELNMDGQDGYRYEKAMPRRGYYDHRMSSYGPQEVGFNGRIFDDY